MALQEALVLTHWKGTDVAGDELRPALSDLLQASESLMNIEGRIKADIVAGDACIVIATGDESRISLMDGTAHKVMWKRYISDTAIGETPVSNFDPATPFTGAQVNALSTWFQNKYGITNTQIANWFNSTPAQLSNWLQTHSKAEAVEKLRLAWRNKIWK